MLAQMCVDDSDCARVRDRMTNISEHFLHVHFAQLRLPCRVEQLQQLSGGQRANVFCVLQLEQSAE